MSSPRSNNLAWNGMECYLGRRPSAGTSNVNQRRGEIKEITVRRKHPTKLIKAVACCLLTLKGREFRIRNKTTYTGKGGSSVYGTKPQNEGKCNNDFI